jgi:hydrogenase/urease accessory protein HupE
MRTCLPQLRLCRTCAAASLLLVCAVNTFAHDPGLSTASVRLQTNGIDVALTLSVKDAGELVSLDLNEDGQTAHSEQVAGEDALTARAAEAIAIWIDDRPAKMTAVKCNFDDNGNVMLHLQFVGMAAGKFQLRSRWLAYLPPGHRQFITVKNVKGDVMVERLLSSNSDSVIIELPSADSAVAEHLKENSFADFLSLGVKHILIGYDHLLFLFSLLIVTRRLVAPLKLITCFTIAHSTTLALATFDLVRIPGKVVEPLIAASIVFVAVENLVRRSEPKGRMWMVLAFGLIHGLGFASVLRELGVGTTGTGIALPLLSFNLGVELGQLLIAAPLVLLIPMLNKHPTFAKRLVPACSILAALAGSLWLIRRVCFA